VIYSASWATLIALLLVIIWLHRRRTTIKEQNHGSEKDATDTGDKKE
jgi:hypothetical protein